ncbi:MAG: hypothetical protein JWO30_3931 [Fibrobacteres bacterium]|nr:hypothetical protein [Fibrobacterota bacterium]
MKNINNKFGRAASITAGLALGLVTVGCASHRTHNGQDASQTSAAYDSSYSDTASPYGGSGMGGTGMGSDSAAGIDTSLNNPYGSGGTGLPGGSGTGGTGMDSARSPDSIDQGNSGGLYPYPGTGGSADTGVGGSTGPGMDTLRLPEDSTRSIDSMGVPDWDEQG